MAISVHDTEQNLLSLKKITAKQKPGKYEQKLPC